MPCGGCATQILRKFPAKILCYEELIISTLTEKYKVISKNSKEYGK